MPTNFTIRATPQLDGTPEPMPTLPARVGRNNEQVLVDLVDQLGIDTPEEWRTVPKMVQMLQARGINTAAELQQALDARAIGRFVPPPRPRKSLSPLYSDIEIVDVLKEDSKIIDIPTVAISTTAVVSIPQLPVRWQITDFTADGAVASSGVLYKIELRIVLGSTPIAKFRLSDLSKLSEKAMISDALRKLYETDIGPNSVLTLEVQNKNTGAGQTFDGFFQYTYQPLLEAGQDLASMLRLGVGGGR